MSEQNKYLLENTPQAKLQVAKIVALLETAELSNIILAFQLLEGGGVPDKVWTYILAIFWTDIYPEEEAVLEHFVKKFAPDDFYDRIEDIYQKGMGKHSDNMKDILEDESIDFPKVIDKKELANQLLLLEKSSYRETVANYCLKHKTIPPSKMLQVFLQDNGHSLDLYNLHLDFLPSEIGDFVHVRYLDISHNNFTEVPEDIAKLKNLDSLSYEDTPLSEESVARLTRYFPKVFADKLYNQANNFFHDKDYKSAIAKIEKSLELDTSNSDAWITKGAVLQYLKKPQESLECFKKAIELSNENMLAWINLSLGLHKMKRYEDSLSITLEALKTFQKYPNISDYWEARLYFRKGQALFFMNRLEEAETAHKKSVTIKPDYLPALYDLACVYSRWHQKDKLLDFLEKAVSKDKKYIEEAKEDTDFKEYWNDKDFKNLLKKASKDI